MTVIVCVVAGIGLMLAGIAMAFLMDKLAGWSRIPFGADADQSGPVGERSIPHVVRATDGAPAVLLGLDSEDMVRYRAKGHGS